MERTVRITGKGKIEVAPDQVIFSIRQSSVSKNYEDAGKEGALAKKELDSALTKAGIDYKKVKTTHYSIDGEYKSYKQNDEWKSKLIGYRYSHDMKLKLDLDNQLMGAFLSAVSKMRYAVEFNMNYGLKNPETAKNELIGEAVKDSRRKAEVLVAALGVELDEVVNIDYSWVQVNVASRRYSAMECDTMYAMKSNCSMEMEPEEIQLEDSVTVIWSIK